MYQTIGDAEFRKRLKNGFDGDTPKAYFFYGEEDYLKRSLLSETLEKLSGGDPMDRVSIDQASYSLSALEDAIYSPPLFAALKPVAVSLAPDDLKPAEIGDLCALLSGIGSDSLSVAVLSIPSGGFDPGLPKRPSALFKKLAEAAVTVLFEHATGARLNGWVGRHFNERGVVAPAPVCAYTVYYCGSDMFRLASEIDKIAFFVKAAGRHEATEEDVRTAGCRSEEFDSFALANAILSSDYPRALGILGYLRGNKVEPARIMAEITRVFCDMAAVSVCRRAGMTPEQISKETGIKPYPLSRYIKAVGGVSDSSLSRAIRLAAVADSGVKGYSRDYVPIEQFICSL